MSDIYIFDAGATKTDLIYIRDGVRKESSFPGFNPNRDYSEFQQALKTFKDFSDEAVVFFYGSGLGSEENKAVVRSIFDFLDTGQLKVYDDILAAGRAAFSSSSGIICIMGTGGLAAYYNGREIVKRRGGYGYLIDDLGGGFELGKRIIAGWLNGDLSEICSKELTGLIDTDKGSLITELYKKNDLKLIADVARTMATVEDESLQKIVDRYLKDFFEQNVLPLTREFGVNNFSIIGSVGTGYYKSIRKQAGSQQLQLDQCIQRPAQRLFDFHMQKR